MRRSRLGVLVASAAGVVLVMSACASPSGDAQAVDESRVDATPIPSISVPSTPSPSPTLAPSTAAPTSTPTPSPARASSWAATMRAKAKSAVAPDRGEPTSLMIDTPAVSIDAPVIPVGVAADGSQEVPTSYRDIGWYERGAKPGRAGNVVVVGHTWSKGDGVFDTLPKLRRNDLVTVRARVGITTYRVVEVVQYTPAEFTAQAGDIYRMTGSPGLVLMTCGDFDPATNEYLTTTTVYAEQVG